MRALMLGDAVAAFTSFENDTIPVGWSPPAGLSLFDGPLPDNVAVGWTFANDDWSEPVYEPSETIPIRVTKADFQRRFTATERYALNALRREIAALTVADYSDPAMTLLVAAEDVLIAFEQPAEFIELNHPETFQGLMLLSYLDVLTEARVTAIIGAAV